MNPELREFVLSLPVEVRRELLKIDGPCWFLHGNLGRSLTEGPDRDDPLDEHATRKGIYRLAYLPVSAKDIAKHAAKLVGAVGHTIETFADRTTASVRFRTADVKPGARLTFSEYADDDFTGHRAAIALLQKIMEARAS